MDLLEVTQDMSDMSDGESVYSVVSCLDHDDLEYKDYTLINEFTRLGLENREEFNFYFILWTEQLIVNTKGTMSKECFRCHRWPAINKITQCKKYLI